ncbi:MAG TPA: hypothetical protein DCG49_05150 [Ruminococcus sp.]|nr:hypothetical protein [Ruminococcus sp.]
MKKQKRMTALLTAACLLTAIPLPMQHAQAETEVLFHDLEGLPFENGDPFKGVDISSVLSLENSGVVFRDQNGNPQDIFQTLAEAGVNTIRVRVWNDPYHSATRENYGGGICDAENAVQIAKRCAKAGLKMLVDFHYSDFWADPGKQNAPKAWNRYTLSQKADAIYQYTTETLHAIRQTGAEIAMVQVGNETTTGMCGVKLADYNWSTEGWRDLAVLFNAGAKAVREFDPATLVCLHFTNPEKASNMLYIAKMLDQTHVDYDVFATSYYPYWHGTLSDLSSVLRSVSGTYHKKVMVAETSWSYTFADADDFPNTIGDASKLGEYESYEISPAGQRAFLHDLFQTIASIPDGMGIGVFYWEPAWLGVGTSFSANVPIWNRFGSGWANACASEFDPEAKEYYGGSSVDNQALFGKDGTPLDSLYVYSIVHGSPADHMEYGKNLFENPGYERNGGWTNQPDAWTLRATADSHFDVRAEDIRSGDYALHWYSERAFSNSSAETAFVPDEDGIYKCMVYIQGDTTMQYQLTAETRNGKTAETKGSGAGWAVWQTPYVEIPLTAGERVTVKLTVSGGAGSYGSADDWFAGKEKDPLQLDTHEITMHQKEKRQLRHNREQVEFVSSDPDVIQIAPDGSLIAVGVGTAEVHAVLFGQHTETVFVTVLPEEKALPDLNEDGSADCKDAKLLQQYLLGNGTLTAEQAVIADRNADQKLNAVDLTIMKCEINN